MDKIIFSHTNTIIDDFYYFAISVVLYFYLELWLVSKQVGVGDRQEPNFIEGVWSIRYKLSKENFFLGVEGVDDDVHQSIWW